MPPIGITHGGGMLSQGRKVLMKKKWKQLLSN
jgi:hypothetical protein